MSFAVCNFEQSVYSYFERKGERCLFKGGGGGGGGGNFFELIRYIR